MSADGRADDRLARRIMRLPEQYRQHLVRSLHASEVRELVARWSIWAHRGQTAPSGDWRVWLIRAGRGFGKTRAGAEWVIQVARALGKDGRIALVGANAQDVRKVMIEGPSGLLRVARSDERLEYRHSTGVVKFPGGATAHVYSANAPESLRGPEHDAAWCDELGKWRHAAAWDNLMMGLRGSEDARVLVTTTPRTNEAMMRVMAADRLVVTTGTTRDNPYLPDTFIAAMLADYGGTRLGRQEIDGEVLEDVEGALFPRAVLDRCRGSGGPVPALARVVIGVDPPASATGDACGIVAVGLGRDGIAYVVEDASVAGQSPEGWAKAVARCARHWRADRVVAEKNNGGEMVRSVLEAADIALPVKLVHASRGKSVRAEPVAAKYERGMVRHAAPFPDLERELGGYLIAGGYAGSGSPDRADACVWALTELLLRRQVKARIKGI